MCVSANIRRKVAEPCCLSGTVKYMAAVTYCTPQQNSYQASHDTKSMRNYPCDTPTPSLIGSWSITAHRFVRCQSSEHTSLVIPRHTIQTATSLSTKLHTSTVKPVTHYTSTHLLPSMHTTWRQCSGSTMQPCITISYYIA